MVCINKFLGVRVGVAVGAANSSGPLIRPELGVRHGCRRRRDWMSVSCSPGRLARRRRRYRARGRPIPAFDDVLVRGTIAEAVLASSFMACSSMQTVLRSQSPALKICRGCCVFYKCEILPMILTTRLSKSYYCSLPPPLKLSSW